MQAILGGLGELWGVLGGLGGVLKVTLGVLEVLGDLLGTSWAVLEHLGGGLGRPVGVRNAMLRQNQLYMTDKMPYDENIGTRKKRFG